MTHPGDLLYTLYISDREPSESKLISVKERLSLQMALGIIEIERSEWDSFWGDVETYDELPYGCKLLMHYMISRVQQTNWMPSWKRVGSKNLDFLSGLLKYNWTKNQLLRKHVHRIDDIFIKLPLVSVYAINGLAENMGEPGPSWFRSNPMVELLIERQTYDEVKKALSAAGFEHSITVPWYFSQRIVGINRTFFHKSDNVRCHLYVLDTERDAHLTAIYSSMSGSAEQSPQQMGYEVRTLRIPGIQYRFIFSVEQVFQESNLATGAYLVHLMDALKLLRVMTTEDLQKIGTLLDSGIVPPDWVAQVINLGKTLGVVESAETDKFLSFLPPSRPSGVGKKKKRMKTRLFSISQTTWSYYFVLLSEGDFLDLATDVLSRIKNRYHDMTRKQITPHPNKRYL